MECLLAIDKKTDSIRWPNMAYESALKPPTGMVLESALLTTYSAEMPAIAKTFSAASMPRLISASVAPGMFKRSAIVCLLARVEPLLKVPVEHDHFLERLHGVSLVKGNELVGR